MEGAVHVITPGLTLFSIFLWKQLCFRRHFIPPQKWVFRMILGFMRHIKKNPRQNNKHFGNSRYLRDLFQARRNGYRCACSCIIARAVLKKCQKRSKNFRTRETHSWRFDNTKYESFCHRIIFTLMLQTFYFQLINVGY